MNAELGFFPEAWLKVQSQKFEPELPTRGSRETRATLIVWRKTQRRRAVRRTSLLLHAKVFRSVSDSVA